MPREKRYANPPAAPVMPAVPSYCNLSITAACNLFCDMCRSAEGVVPRPNKERVLGFLDRLGGWLPAGYRVQFSGGEPLTHPHLDEFMARLRLHGVASELNTNGALLTVERVGRLRAAGLTVINVSLDGIGETHDRLRNAPGLYQGVRDMLHYLTTQTDLQVNVLTVIHALNAGDLPGLADDLLATYPRRCGIRYQAIMPTLARPWSADFFRDDPLWPRERSELDQVHAVLDALLTRKRAGARIHNSEAQFAVWRRYFADPLAITQGDVCPVPFDALQVMADGTIRFCTAQGDLGTIDDDPAELWRSERTAALREEARRCTLPCNAKINCCFDLAGGA